MLRAFEELCARFVAREALTSDRVCSSSPLPLPLAPEGCCSAPLAACVDSLVQSASPDHESDWNLQRFHAQLMPAANPLALQLLVGHLLPRLIRAFHENRSSTGESLTAREYCNNE